MPGGTDRGMDSTVPDPIEVEGQTLDLTGLFGSSPAKLRRYAEDLHEFTARILGRSLDLSGAHGEVAMQFNDVIKWDISTLGEGDQLNWSEVAEGVDFCAALTEEWAEALDIYREERTRIVLRWNEEAPGVAEDVGKSGYPLVENIINGRLMSKSELAMNDLVAFKEELEEEEGTAYTALVEASSLVADDLRDGPNVDAVERLRNGGHMSWSNFNITGDPERLPEDVDPVEMGERLPEYWDPSSDKELDDEYYEMIAILNNLGWRAGAAQELDDMEMEPEEMEFLKDFMDSLEENQEGGVMGIPDQVNNNSAFSDEDAAAALGAIGGGLLVLSDKRLTGGDEGVPGGYYDLPQSFRDAAEGGRDGLSLTDSEWVALGELMGHAPEHLEGGRGLSLTMNLSIGDHLHLSQDLFPIPEHVTESMQDIIDVASRNKDANADLLAGPGEGPDSWYNHPGIETNSPSELDELRENALEALLVHNWEDDGEAVGGYTRWILEDELSDDEEDNARAGRASEGLIKFLTDIEDDRRADGKPLEDGDLEDPEVLTISRYEYLMNLEGVNYDLDPDAPEVLPNLSFTQQNPEIANAFLEIFAAYSDDFGLETSGDDVNYRDDGVLVAGSDARVRFFEFISGSPEAATAMVALTEQQSMHNIEDIFSTEQRDPGQMGQQNSRLEALVNQALVNEAHYRTANADDAIEEANARREQGRELLVSMSFGALDAISPKSPITEATIGVLLSGAEQATSNALKDSLQMDLGDTALVNEEIDSSTNAVSVFAGRAFLEYYVESGELGEDDFDGLNFIELDSGRVVLSGEFTSTNRYDAYLEIRKLLNEVESGVGDFSASEAFQEYREEYGNVKLDENDIAHPSEHVENALR